MRNKGLRGAFSYCFSDITATLTTAFGIYALVCLGIGVLDLLFPENVNVYVGGGGAVTMSYTITMIITMFVIGIVGVREYLRMLVQHGRSRKTAFCGYVLAVFAAAGAVIAVFLVLYLFERLFTGVYYYEPGNLCAILALVMVNAMLWGSAISLMFWRLPKKWKFVGAVGLPVFILYILPLAIVNTRAEAFLDWLFSDYGPMIFAACLTSAMAALLCFALSRRIGIRAAA